MRPRASEQLGKDYIRGLNGIRAIAVLLVVCTHAHLYQRLFAQGRFFEGRVLPMVTGRTGVLAFFVMSGFLITLLLVKEHARTGAISVKDFYIRRALRIFPLYFLVVGITVLVAAAGHHVLGFRSLPFAFSYTYNFVPRAYYAPILGHTWSLAVEEHFYLVWPLAVSALITRKPRSLFWLSVGFYAAGYVVHLALADLTSLDAHYFVRRWTFVAGGSIALGAALALIVSGGPPASLLKHPFAAGLGVALFCHSLVVGDIDPGGDQIRALGIFLVIGWMYLNPSAAAVSALEWGPLNYIGKISYGIYMWQGFFLATGPERAPGQTWPPGTLVGVALLCIVAPLSYELFELRFLKMKHRFSGARRGPQKEIQALSL